MKSLIAPRLIPSVAIMNENSPTGARLKLLCNEVRTSTPPNMNENTPTMLRITSTTNVITTIGSQYLASMAGLIIIPTETKNTAANKSFIGETRCSMCSASTVSAKMLPMTNAPKAGEKPANDANTTIRKHKASATISSVSSFISVRALRSNRGIR